MTTIQIQNARIEPPWDKVVAAIAELQKMIELKERRIETGPKDWLCRDLTEFDELIRMRRREVNMAAAQAMAENLENHRI